MPAVSVVVPVHNVAPYLEKTVCSIQEQELADIEIILVENLSSDGSVQICETLAASDPRIRIIRLDRAGLSLARNSGIAAASAEYVCCIDGDDTIESDMLSDMYGALVEYGADIAVCNYVLDYTDRPPVYRYAETGQTRHYTSDGMLAEMFQEHISNSACVMLVRKSLFGNVSFPEGRYFEDHATTYRLVAEAARGCVHIGHSYYHYLQRPGSICDRLDFRKAADFAEAALERLAFIHAHEGFSRKEKKLLMQNDIKIYVLYMIEAISHVRTQEEKSRLEKLKDEGNVILTYGAAKGRRKDRLLRMKYLWKLFYRQHRKGQLQ